MATSPLGSQLAIPPWELAQELASYLASRGVGTFTLGAVKGNTIFLDRMPDSPVVATSIVIDPSPRRDPVSRPHFSLYFRDTHVATAGARAAIAFGILHRTVPTLPSFHLQCWCDGEPIGHTFNQNNLPVARLSVSTAGVIRRT